MLFVIKKRLYTVGMDVGRIVFHRGASVDFPGHS